LYTNRRIRSLLKVVKKSNGIHYPRDDLIGLMTGQYQYQYKQCCQYLVVADSGLKSALIGKVKYHIKLPCSDRGFA
jgi:hypothetical protein